MHPAGSVIIFTVASGLGFGLLTFLGLGMPEVRGWAAFWYYFLGFGLAVGGLVSSTFHLGNPQRAWRAFSQWRTSWLSREGCFAVAALLILGLFAIGAIFLGRNWQPLGMIGAVLSLATVGATSMIYGQLKTVPRWNHWTTPCLYVALSLAGGAILAAQITVAIVLLVISGVLQLLAWMLGDGQFKSRSTDLGTATGLGERGTVRAFEPPHTGTNYLMKEMVHVVGRKHAMKLRVIAMIGMILLPLAVLIAIGGIVGIVLAVIFHALGALAQRWLFFAEAEHVVGLYYGKR